MHVGVCVCVFVCVADVSTTRCFMRDICMYVCVCVCVYVCMYVWVYVCVYADIL